MRKKICELLVFLVLLGGFYIVTLDTVPADLVDGDYTYTEVGGVATVTGYTGPGGAIAIPSTLGGYPTAHIGDNSFKSCTSLTSVTIPSNVSTIGENAFRDCTSITSMTMGSGITTIKDNALRKCSSLISLTFLGFVAPTTVYENWILETHADLKGHAYNLSNFSPPGEVWNGLMMGAYISENDPPVFETPSPTNGSTGNPLTLTWRIPISDPDGDYFSWTIQCSNGQANSGTTATNGTKTVSISGLAYQTTYRVWVNATDPPGSGLYTRRWYIFTTLTSGGGGGTSPENIKPVANASAGEPYQGFINTTILFDGSRSYDPDGTITSWFWEFGDDTSATGETVQHTYLKIGTYNVTLTVTDDTEATNKTTTTCIITNPTNRPPTKPTITGPTTGTKNTVYNYTVLATDPDNDTIRYSIAWGDHSSSDNVSTFLPSGTPFIGSHRWTTPGQYIIVVSVTDNQTRLYAQLTIDIEPEKEDTAVPLDGNLLILIVIIIVAVLSGAIAIAVLWTKGYI